MGTLSRLAPAAAVLVVNCLRASAALGQIPWDSTRWRVEAQEFRVDRFEGRDGLWLRSGIAWLSGSAVRDGVVHFDLHSSAELGFHGLAFRAADAQNYEHFYLRPFVSDNPDATQYTPVFNGVSGWQIYSGPRYGQPVTVRTDRWIHVEVRFRDRRAEVYVDGVPLAFPALQRAPVAGGIGLTSTGAPARFANVVVVAGPPDMAAGAGAPVDESPPGLVRTWRISTPFDESVLDSLGPIPPDLAGGLQWTSVQPDTTGIVNLAMVRPLAASANTVFAAVTLQARRSGPARIRFGFSDRVHVYVNGRPIFRGDDGWRARDYKFLGTVGLFDELVLPLRAGENEVWFAVSESFGGWGVIMQLVDRTEVSVVSR